MQWTTGDRVGGFGEPGRSEAVAGINAGDGYNYYTVTGSQTPSILDITQTSNVGTPGVWMYNLKCMCMHLYVLWIHFYMHSYIITCCSTFGCVVALIHNMA